MTVIFDKQEFWAYLSFNNTLTVQPREIEVSEEYVEKNIIPEIAKRYGSLKTKEGKIMDLEREIRNIRMSIAAEKRKYKLDVCHPDECPF